ANYFAETFKKMGGEIVADQSYQAGEIDFKGQLTDIRSKKPEAIFVPGYYTEVGLIARQAKQLGLKVPLLGGDGWDSSKLYEIGKTKDYVGVTGKITINELRNAVKSAVVVKVDGNTNRYVTTINP